MNPADADDAPFVPPPEPESHRFDADDGVPLHFARWPGPAAPAPVLLLVHGRRAHCRWFDPIVPALAERYEIASLDLRAHGDSGTGGGPTSLERYARDIAAFVERFAGRPRLLVSHSMAGRATLLACERHGLAPDRLVLADTPLLLRPHLLRPEPPFKSKIYPTRDEALRRFRLMPVGTTASRAVLRHVAECSVRPTPCGGWTWKFDDEGTGRPFPATIPTFEELPLESVPCPTLAIRGECSALVDEEHLRATAARIPRAVARTIPDAHHHLMLDRPAEFAAALVEFFEAGETG